MNALWWLPSVIVFGTTALIIIGIVAAVKAARRRGIASGRIADSGPEPLEKLEIRAGQALVQADEATRRGAEELAFAAAQFGPEATADFAKTLEVARTSLSRAFELRQKLSDVEPDTDAERRTWSEQVLDLCTRVETELSEQIGLFTGKRAEERDAPQRLAALRSRIDEVTTRIPDAEAALVRLAKLYRPQAFADQADAVQTAEAQLAIATGEVEKADAAADAVTPTTPALDRAEQACSAAAEALDSVARVEKRLAEADVELRQTVAAATSALDEAAELRDSSELPDAATTIAAAITELRSILDGIATADGPAAPLADLDRVRAGQHTLDDALATARTAQRRIDNARSALDGALFSARTHLETARELISKGRGRVGADARTRLSEAERQLALAEAASDPVEALDIARRVSRLAQDADALARYDAGPRVAPVARGR